MENDPFYVSKRAGKRSFVLCPKALKRNAMKRNAVEVEQTNIGWANKHDSLLSVRFIDTRPFVLICAWNSSSC